MSDEVDLTDDAKAYLPARWAAHSLLQVSMLMNCPVCGSDDTEIKKVMGHYKILKCRRCKLFWVPEVDTALLKGFYESQYFQGSHQYGYADYVSGGQIQRANARRLLRIVADRIVPRGGLAGSKLLDIGCAHGFLVDEACKIGLDAQGVDCSTEACSYATGVLQRQVFLGDLVSMRLPSNAFDVVTSIGSIEHLIDPVSVVAEAARILKQKGLFIITTLDTQLRLFRFKPPEHLYYFSRYNLTLLLERNGFTVESVAPYKSVHALGEATGLLAKVLLGRWVDLDPLIERLPWKKITLTLRNNEMLVIARKR